MEQIIQDFKAYLGEMRMFRQAQAIMSFDDSTIAPKAGVAARARRNGFFAQKVFKMTISEEMKGFLDALESEVGNLDAPTAAMYRIAKKNYDKNTKIPVELVREFSELTAKAHVAWEQARENDDFEHFAPYLEQIVAKSKEMVGYRLKEGQHPYNILLDDFEEGMTMEIYDEFFAKLRETIVPVLKTVVNSGKQPEAGFMREFVPKADQEKISFFAAEKIGYDLERGYITESTHPFCNGSHKTDVRMTTRYDENDFISSFYSILHESGHAIYEQSVCDEISDTILSRGISMGFHESQSRFYENVIGRSRGFWEYIAEELKTYLPESFKDITPEQFYRATNQARPSLIRVEADELTYSLHIMVRYEIERMLFNDEISVRDLPEVWNKKYEEYLGITPPNNTLGVLQDIHWSMGAFGYFPTYALGTAYASQFVAQMKKDIDMDALIAKGDFAAITAWMTGKIHRHGSIYTPAELLKQICGEQLNADYYTAYLKGKFEGLYS
ncbi:MAG: carboxypeptidase M32 [Clostridiales bacterium]|jgi:carboxypeptidase Taq|nr:carboxypeptidase M32 [Clostridiales bacterium]